MFSLSRVSGVDVRSVEALDRAVEDLRHSMVFVLFCKWFVAWSIKYFDMNGLYIKAREGARWIWNVL